MSADSTVRQVVAMDTTFEDYLENYAADFHEFVRGDVIKMSPINLRHDRIMLYVRLLLEAYFERRSIGKVIGAPFTMRLSVTGTGREPDLQVVLNSNPGELHDTFMDGPADICVEVVSPESIQRDHGEKFEEYERGGVPEYWILDWIYRECRFFRLNEAGLYVRQVEDSSGDYRSPLLPDFRLNVPTLWEDNFPGPAAIAAAVLAMLNEL